MNAPLILDLAALRQAVDRCLDACQQQLGEQVSVEADPYWLIEPSAAFDLSGEPSINSGRLSDDLDEVTAINATRDDDQRALWHELGHLLGPLARLASLATP